MNNERRFTWRLYAIAALEPSLNAAISDLYRAEDPDSMGKAIARAATTAALTADAMLNIEDDFMRDNGGGES